MPVYRRRPWCRRGPVDGVLDDALDVLIVVGGVLLVAWTEVEDPTPPPPVTQAAPEDLPTSEPAHEDELVRLRYVEGLPVHLLFELYVLPAPLRYGMPWRDDPEPLYIVVTPFEVAGGAHKLLEDLREGCWVQPGQPHPAKPPLVFL